MSSLVNYIVMVGGAQFNAVLGKHRATSAEIEEFNSQAVRWEARFPETQMQISADLSSSVATLVSLPIPYAWLSTSRTGSLVTQDIDVFESRLRDRFPSAVIYRFDEELLREWHPSHEDWIRDTSQVAKFLDWLKVNDGVYARRIN